MLCVECAQRFVVKFHSSICLLSNGHVETGDLFFKGGLTKTAAS